ncbi:MAG: Gfo/Idh/MocA family protein [Promethearchaeota archaeon]
MVKKIAIIGFGSQAQTWLKAIQRHQDWEVSGVIDTNTELLDHVPGLIPNLTEDDCFMTIDDMIALSDKGKPDAALICTPIYTHHVLVQEAMDLDINVICEKNMASTIYQGRQMVQAALDKPYLSTAVGTQYRYFTKNWTTHKFFTEPGENMIGDLAFIRIASAGNWGEKRRGWRRWLQEIYLEDMCTHWFDLLRYWTGMDIVQVYADTFIPKYSKWKGSSTVFVNLALAHKDDYNHRHNWVWAQIYGDWQARGPGFNSFMFYGEKGQAEQDPMWGMKVKLYLDEDGTKWEEDGYLPQRDIMNLGTDYQGQEIILEMMSRSIDSKGKDQPDTNFIEGFKSFAVSMGAIESSRTGKAVWVPKYWEDMDIE